jgi:hypothetical protein
LESAISNGTSNSTLVHFLFGVLTFLDQLIRVVFNYIQSIMAKELVELGWLEERMPPNYQLVIDTTVLQQTIL